MPDPHSPSHPPLGHFGLDASLEAPQLRVGTWLGDYQLLAEVARGGMGVVYKARHRQLERIVAVKVLTQGSAANAHQLERFRREALAAARLSHPNIVQILDAGDYSGQPYLVMDFVDGDSLEQRIEAVGAFEPRVAARLIEQIARGLQHAHEEALLHRDVKPANVILDPGGKPLLTDFGLAKDLRSTSAMTQSGQLLGTPAYMSPEQAQGQGAYVDARADVYSLGATLFALLTARPPFESDQPFALLNMITNKEATPPSKLGPGIAPDLDTICLKCLEKLPAERYPTAEAVADELGRFLRGEPIHAQPPGLGARLRHVLVKRKRAVIGLALLAAVALVVQVGATLREGSRQVTQAEKRSEAAWERTETLTGDRLESGLAALQAAQQYHDVSNGSDQARDDLVRAATHLGEVAADSKQWGLAIQAYRTASTHGGNPLLVETVLEASRAEATRKRDAIAFQLQEVASGRAQQRAAGLWTASFTIVRNLDSHTLDLVVRELDRLTDELEATRQDLLSKANILTADERNRGEGQFPELEAALEREAAGTQTATDLRTLQQAEARLVQRAAGVGTGSGPAPDFTTLLARRQSQALGATVEDLVHVLCRVLGHSDARQSLAPLRRYLAAEASQVRAAPAGIALCLLGDEETARDALSRFSPPGVYHTALRGYLITPEDTDGAVESASGSVESLLREAQRALVQLKYSQARGLFRIVLDQQPANTQGLLGLASSEFLLRDYAESLATLKRLTDAGHASAEASSLRGANLALLQEHAAALVHYDDALTRDPKLKQAHVGKLRSLFDLKRPVAARTAFQRALEVLGPEPLRVFKAFLLYYEGKLKEAQQAVKAALVRNPNDVDALRLSSQIHKTLGHAEPALADLNRALETASGDAQLYALRSAIYLDLIHDPQRALLDIERASGLLGGASYPLQIQRARCLIGVRDHLQATKLLEGLLKDNRDRHEGYILLANCLDALGEGEREWTLLTACVERFPKLSLGWISLGRNRLKAGQLSDAEAATRRGLQLQASFPGAANLAIVLLRLGRRSEALVAFEHAMNLGGKTRARPLLVQRAITHLELGDLPSARHDLENLVATGQPPSALAAACFGRLQVLEGNPAAGLARLNEILTRQPGQGHALLWRGLSLWENGQHAAARQDLNAFLKSASAEDARRAEVQALLAE